MRTIWRFLSTCVLLTVFVPASALAQSPDVRGANVLDTWYRLTLELVRHTPTYSPPVASRSFAYLGVTAFEIIASGRPDLISLAGQLNGFEAPPQREPGKSYDDAVALQAATALAVRNLFGNTGPTGQRAIEAINKKLRFATNESVDPDVVARSDTYGRAVAQHILDWAESDGGAVVENLGFPYKYELTPGPEHWVPTSQVGLQQVPLLPAWGNNRSFAMPEGATCSLPPPPTYSEDKSSGFYKEALEVYEVSKSLTKEQEEIARFWSDDPMLTSTPPGHWLSIMTRVLDEQEAPLDVRADALARLGIALADAFIGCWYDKFEYDLVRPVTFIHRIIDPEWQVILITPPFPEYPSGHSTQSGAAAEVLTHLFGTKFAFEDTTHEDDGLPSRSFPSFWAAAEEAGISRLYGGIHYRAAIELGLEQGKCIAAYTNALRTRR